MLAKSRLREECFSETLKPDPDNAGVGSINVLQAFEAAGLSCGFSFLEVRSQIERHTLLFGVFNSKGEDQFMTTEKKKLRMLVEGALFVAMAYVLSFIEIKVAWQYGGSIDFVMIPLIIYAIRWGTGSGLMAGLVFGTIKFFMSGGVAVNWQSMLLDYSLAYMFVGFAGVLKNRASLSWLAAVIGCFARFIIHFVSGVTIYAEYMPPIFMGWEMTSPTVYSILYNGSYMLPSAVIAIAGCLALQKGLRRFLEATDLNK